MLMAAASAIMRSSSCSGLTTSCTRGLPFVILDVHVLTHAGYGKGFNRLKCNGAFCVCSGRTTSCTRELPLASRMCQASTCREVEVLIGRFTQMKHAGDILVYSSGRREPTFVKPKKSLSTQDRLLCL